MHCVACQTPLTNGSDTFGAVNQEMCMSCWFALREDAFEYERQHSWAETFALATNFDGQIQDGLPQADEASA